MKYGIQLEKVRRFLRDPNSKIWDDDFLKVSYNDIQREIQHFTGYIENVEVISLPPFYQWSYFWDWEWRHLFSGGIFYKSLLDHQQGQYKFCNLWEMQGEYGNSGVIAEAGAHFTQPWEAWADTPGEVVKNK